MSDPFSRFEKPAGEKDIPAGLAELAAGNIDAHENKAPRQQKSAKIKEDVEVTVAVNFRAPESQKAYVESLAGHNGIKSFSDAMRSIINFHKENSKPASQ